MLMNTGDVHGIRTQSHALPHWATENQLPRELQRSTHSYTQPYTAMHSPTVAVWLCVVVHGSVCDSVWLCMAGWVEALNITGFLCSAHGPVHINIGHSCVNSSCNCNQKHANPTISYHRSCRPFSLHH